MSRSTNSQLKSFPFYIITTPSAFDIDYIISSDEFQALTRNITRTEEAIDEAKNVISDIETLEASVKQAEDSRVNAENTRATNEDARKTAETARQTSENIRNKAENTRNASESTRQANESSRQTNTATAIANANNAADRANNAAEVCEAFTGNHTHDDRYYTESEVDTKLSNKANSNHSHSYNDISDRPTFRLEETTLYINF